MKKIVSISGGKTSAYLASNYKADDYVFALVRTSDQNCQFKDRKTAKIVEDKIQREFVGTLEEDTIIYTMLDLEQHIGKRINWVSGITFDEVVNEKGGMLPNKLHRYCTAHMKILPIFKYWLNNYSDPIEMLIGFRANEHRRAVNMSKRVNKNGLLEQKYISGKHNNGRNKWTVIEWQKPVFPLIEDAVFKADIENYWTGKFVRFAELNNCVGCFHRSAQLLNYMASKHNEKLEWFASKEGGKKGFWKYPYSYRKIIDSHFSQTIDFNDESFCGSGYCGIN